MSFSDSFSPAKPHKTSLSATMIAGNDDLLTEILVRTPAKSLIRFKCVSKHFLSLITSPLFSLLHTRRNPNPNPSGIILRKPKSLSGNSEYEFDLASLNKNSISLKPPFTSLNFINNSSAAGIHILQSCNGLLLCSMIQKMFHNYTPNYYVYNPTTRLYSTVSPPNSVGCVLGVNLAFDPSKSPHDKIIRVQNTPNSMDNYCIYIYSSDTGCWRPSGHPFTGNYNNVFFDGVFWNGSINWVGTNFRFWHFDVDREVLVTMPSLPGRREQRYRYFFESNGHLHLIETYSARTTQFEVLEMESDYSQWFVKYYVDLHGILTAFPKMIGRYKYYAFTVLGLVRYENEDDSSLVIHIPGKVLSYNLKDNIFMVLYDFAGRKIGRKGLLQIGCSDAYMYIESLACV